MEKVTASSTTSVYCHDGLNVVAKYDGSDQFQRTYVSPGLDRNLSMTASGSTYCCLTDALDSIRRPIEARACLLPMTPPADSR